MDFWLSTAFLETALLVDLARGAEEAGFDGITVADHLAYVRSWQDPRRAGRKPRWAPETPWPEPFTVIAAMAAVTERLRFTTNIYVAPARDLFSVARSVATAAAISGDRVALGAAVGWSPEEYAGAGVPFRTRGRRLEEMIELLRALWRGEFVEADTAHFTVPGLRISPVPGAPVPIYLGGESERALTRAVRVGDGYIGQIYDQDAALELADRVRQRRREEQKSGPFGLMLSLWKPTVEDVLRLESAGATALVVAPHELAGRLARAGPGRIRTAVRESLEPWLGLMEGVRGAR